MAIAGEPLSGHHAVLLYSVQVSKGSPVTPATAFGILEAPDGTIPSGLRPLFGLGSATFLVAKPGITSATVNTGNFTLQSSAFLTACCARASGALPWVTLGIGYKDDAGTMWAWQIPDCKVANFELSWDGGGAEGAPLMCNVAFQSVGAVTEIATLSPANLATLPWDQYECVLTRAGASHEAASWRMSVNENLHAHAPIYGAAPASNKRSPKYLQEGRLEISGEVRRFAKSGINMVADTLTSAALVVTATDIAAGVNTLTVTLGTSYYTEEQINLGENILFRCPFIAQTLTLA